MSEPDEKNPSPLAKPPQPSPRIGCAGWLWRVGAVIAVVFGLLAGSVFARVEKESRERRGLAQIGVGLGALEGVAYGLVAATSGLISLGAGAVAYFTAARRPEPTEPPAADP